MILAALWGAYIFPLYSHILFEPRKRVEGTRPLRSTKVLASSKSHFRWKKHEIYKVTLISHHHLTSSSNWNNSLVYWALYVSGTHLGVFWLTSAHDTWTVRFHKAVITAIATLCEGKKTDSSFLCYNSLHERIHSVPMHPTQRVVDKKANVLLWLSTRASTWQTEVCGSHPGTCILKRSSSKWNESRQVHLDRLMVRLNTRKFHAANW